MSPAAPRPPVRLAVLLSGGGSTLQNFVDRIAHGELSARIELVIASRDGVGGIARAAAAGLRCEVVPRAKFADVDRFNDELHTLLKEVAPDLVLLAGFLSPFQLRGQYRERVMNIHPSLIPAFCGQGFYGERVHRAVIDAGVKVSGCTVHFADDQYDTGPIILQRAVPVLDDDTPATLAARVHQAENELYPEAVRLWAAGRLEVHGRRVWVRANDA